MNEKQLQAKRTVVIQVGSEQSFPELFNYCLQYGEIDSCHHYQIGKGGHHFILLQFLKEENAKELLTKSCSNGNYLHTTVKSPFLWFKTGKKPSVSNSTQYGKGVLSSKYGLTSFTGDSLNEKLRQASSIDQQMKIIISETQLNDLSIRLRFLAAKQIEDALHGMFPFNVAYPFGSSVNGFGKMGCDLDMILKLDDREEVKPTRLIFHAKENFSNERAQKQRQMESIADMLHIFLPGVDNVRRILQARVPIIKYHQDYLNLEVDLSMNDL